MTKASTPEQKIKYDKAIEYFGQYDWTQPVGNIDFCVSVPDSPSQIELYGIQSFLWAEAKRGVSDIYKSFIQLILTIGKAQLYNRYLPPLFLGAFDEQQIAFIEYKNIKEVFYQNDFNWNVTPSNHETKEFKQLYASIKKMLEENLRPFDWKSDNKDLRNFIKDNFAIGKENVAKIRIDKTNLMHIYPKWMKNVKPTIAIDWDIAKKKSIIDGDFFIADLFSDHNITFKTKLPVLLMDGHYELDRTTDNLGLFGSKRAGFTDKQKAHKQFWNKYERPPKEEYWDYIINRRDLLVPQDVRERKGSFFTPQIWVELSQQYLADTLGEDWQDEYYIWDCAAGTGNLLAGLTNEHRIWASTLDRQDVDVMHDRIKNGANLMEDHVFQFDFLNDNFSKLPQNLQNIINNPEERKKLIIYINPPYAEASNKKTLTKGVEGNRGVEQTMVNQNYAKLLGQGNAELFAQFLTRIYFEIEGATIAQFSKLKTLSGQHFIDFRKFFLAKLEKAFVVPANTFDNVKGSFPIGFMIWDTNKKEKFEHIVVDVYNHIGNCIGTKSYWAYDNSQYMNDWIKLYRAEKGDPTIIGKFPFKGNDFQNQNMVQIVHEKMEYNTEAGQFLINQSNLIEASVYFAVRKCIEATWLNDRDQFLYPNEGWESDTDFQHDCLAYTLFTHNIQAQYGTNHWIPFTEKEVKPRSAFKSHFMTDFIAGKLKDNAGLSLFKKDKIHRTIPLVFSLEAQAVFEAGKALWAYYHAVIKAIPLAYLQPEAVNASLYDIREYFQGRSDKGKMNNRSEDETYTALIATLREKLKELAKKIEPKVYAYGFLKA